MTIVEHDAGIMGQVNHYAQGKRLEDKVRDLLRAAGYVVLRTAGSKGACDLIAVKPGQVLLVQVKRTSAPGPADWNALYDLAEMAAAVPVLATCSPRKPVRYERLTGRKIPGSPVASFRLLEPFTIDFAEEAPCSTR